MQQKNSHLLYFLNRCNYTRTNQKDRRAVAKLRAGNHNLRIETGIHFTPKLPEHLFVKIAAQMKWKTKHTSSYFATNIYDTIRKSLVEDIINKYPDFDYLNANHKIVFHFNSTDAVSLVKN